MEQAIREHDSKIIAHVDGYAASAASFLIMGADEIEAAPGSFIMIHKAWTLAFGNSDDLIKTADLLEQVDASLVKTYAEHTGQSADKIESMMAAETWMEADRAVELGFADRVAENPKKAKASAKWDLSAYQNSPRIEEEKPQVDREALARAAAAKLISA
jgi:ATP-dependent Clp protease protease subunit